MVELARALDAAALDLDAVSAEVAEALRAALPRLEEAGEDTTFPRSLLRQWDQKKWWSEKQLYWAGRLSIPDEFEIDFAALNGRMSLKNRGRPNGHTVSRIHGDMIDVRWIFPESAHTLRMMIYAFRQGRTLGRKEGRIAVKCELSTLLGYDIAKAHSND